MKVTCYILDDEPYAIDFLSRFIERTPELELIGSNTNAVEALGKFLAKEISADIIFVDIEMPKLNGLDFAAQVGHLAQVVLVTGDNSQSLQAYELGVVDYLIKPVSYLRFINCINRIRKNFPSVTQSPVTTADKVALRHGPNHIITYVSLKDITHAEASSNYSIVYSEGMTPIKTYISISDLGAELGTGFLRVHRSFIINLSKVSRFFGNTIVIGKGTEIPLGKSYREDFIRATKSGGIR